MSRRPLPALLLVLVLVLGACAQTPSVTRSSTAPTVGATAPPTESDPQSAPALAAAKKAAKIEDCPTSDPKVAAVSGGLPNVVLSCLGGGRSVRLAGLRGRPLIINVWAQWCPPCREEAPYFTELTRQASGAVTVLGVDYQDPRAELAIEFARASTWTYPQLADLDQVLARSMQIAGPPVTLFVRADGTVAGRYAGGLTSTEQLRSLSRTYLGVTP